MILRVIFDVSLEDNEGNVIKRKEYGKAYLADIDMEKAAEDWWLSKFNKKEFKRDSNEVYKIVDIITNAFKRTVMGRFLCNSGEVYRKQKQENK